MIGHPLLQHIANRLDELVLPRVSPPREQGLLIGFSGGPDSLILLLGAHLWRQQNYDRTVEAAHLHHELRPGDADNDLVFCRNKCAELGLVLHENRLDPRPVASRRGLGLEEAGRHLRHTFMQGVIAKSDHLHWLALGHHRDDQVETILMRLFRGTGPQGLKGIPAVNENVIHPLLDLSRTEIIRCLEELGESWRVDISNLKGDNLRARLRREVIPVLNGVFGPGAHTKPLALAHLMTDDLMLLEDLTRQATSTVQVPDRPERLDRKKLLALAPALASRVLHHWLSRNAPLPGRAKPALTTIGKVHVTSALAWIKDSQSGTRLDLPGGCRLERDFQEIVLSRPGTVGPILRNASDYRIDVTRAVHPDDPDDWGLTERNGVAIDGGWQLTCPAEALQGHLRVDNFRPGDKIMPLGLEGSKKLSDLFREHRIPVQRRAGILVIRDEKGILWVVGLARSERTRLLPNTDKIVTISVIERRHETQRGN